MERFRAAFNRIEGYLRHYLHERTETEFIRLLNKYGDQHSIWNARDGRRLRDYASLRNALVHNYYNKDEYLSIPVPYVVADIERIAQELVEPDKVIPKFQRSVSTLKTSDTLVEALTLIQKHSYSQLPVYDQLGNFRGLLTENGITRWLSAHVVDIDELVSFRETSVGKVLSSEEPRRNYQFVSRNKTVLDVVSQFGHEPLLEAILISHNGIENEKLLGILTRWDIQEYLR